jgi:hypothetical protein
LAERVELAEHHPELQHGEAAEQPRPDVERVELERVLAAQQQPEHEGDEGTAPEQAAERESPPRAPPPPGRLRHRDGARGDRDVDEREPRGGQPREKERVARGLEQRVPGERPEDREEGGERAAAVLGTHFREAHSAARRAWRRHSSGSFRKLHYRYTPMRCPSSSR